MPGKKQGQGNQESSPSLDQQFRAALVNQAQAQAAEEGSDPVAEQGLELPFAKKSSELAEPSERQELIWEAARQLEEVAAILEEVRDYDRADQLRHSAAELWKSARK